MNNISNKTDEYVCDNSTHEYKFGVDPYHNDKPGISHGVLEIIFRKDYQPITNERLVIMYSSVKRNKLYNIITKIILTIVVINLLIMIVKLIW